MLEGQETDQKGKQSPNRPAFIDTLNHAYRNRRQNVFLLTGRTHDLFWNPEAGDFTSLERLLYWELKKEFTVVRMDIATGLSFYDKSVEQEVENIYGETERLRIRRMSEQSQGNPLATLMLLKGIADAFIKKKKGNHGVKPLCVVVQYVGSLFPDGDFSRLSELDRQRLVFFLSWVNEPEFVESPNFLVLINPVKSEVNTKITALPNATHIEIELPDECERAWFVERFIDEQKQKRETITRFEGGRQSFCQNIAGLKLADCKMMLEAARRTKQMVKRQDVVDVVNDTLQAELGDIVRFKRPTHTPDDIIGYAQTREIFMSIFERCEDAETAIPAIIVSGPNGSGKTFQLEAYAAESGRVVMELAGIRGQYFGQTDQFFEMLRWHIRTFGKILILVDEAHTAFGSVHAQDVHATERRLAGNILKMMGDPAFLGKVLWGLMTSRPDGLDPDVKSRAPIQIPIFDPEGEDRRMFVAEMFKRKNIHLSSAELDEVLDKTSYYSPRDYRNLVAEVLSYKRKHPERGVMDVLRFWQVSGSIEEQRELQKLFAAQHCSYPQLLPREMRDMTSHDIKEAIEKLKWSTNFQ